MSDLITTATNIRGMFSAVSGGARFVRDYGAPIAGAVAMGNPAGLTMTAASWVLSSAFTGSVGVLGASWATKLLLDTYGGDIARGVYNTVSTEMSKLPFHNNVWGTPPPIVRQPPALFSLENAQLVVGQASKHSRALFAVLVFSGLQYLHALGAYEMQRQVRARIESLPSVSAAPSNASQKTSPEALSALYSQMAAEHKTGPASKKGEDADAAILERLLHSLYAQHPFYAPVDNVEAAYFTLSGNHPVRMVVNLLLGFLLQLNALLSRGGGAIEDPIADLARFTSVVAYFELLMRSLRLYGWAPLYVGTSFVARLFESDPATQTVKIRSR